MTPLNASATRRGAQNTATGLDPSPAMTRKGNLKWKR
jgi:hypothetical protein